jgi:diguanylate cyclase (GGDEF)-like protein/PAS domain S-box-containing protein
VCIDNQQLYKGILDSFFEGVYFVDLHKKILFWNEAAERISGYSASEVVGSHCFDNILIHVDESGKNLCKSTCPLSITMETGIIQKVKVFLHHKKGHRVPVSIKTIPLRNEETGLINGAVEIFKPYEDMSSVEKRIEELENLAWKDELCQIPNRRFLTHKLEDLVEMFKKFDMDFGILFVDIDHFKRVNDTYSHEVGDRVLKMISNTLMNNIRGNDLIARWGGEEFIICLNNVKSDEFKRLAERFRMLVENSFISEENNLINVTISIGATLVNVADNLESLIKRADDLLYVSKENGRNRVTFG